jgi:hypothetical protein
MMLRLARAAVTVLLAATLTVGAAAPAHAWQLAPEATATERGMAASAGQLQRAINRGAFQGVAVVGNPVHEEITRRALRCPTIESSDVRWSPGCEIDIRYQEAGVRWNDDPAFKFLPGRGEYLGCRAGHTVRLVTQPVCWARVFKHGESAAARGERLTGRNSNLLARSHFGDLQFLHAMAATDGEAPEQTRRNVMAWLEFTWRASMGDDGFGSQRMVSRLPIDGFAERFRYNQDWRIQDLFALGNPGARDADSIRKIAFGSLIHVVEDSFAAGHVDRVPPKPGASCAGWRAPGEIREFHSYPRQDSHKHGLADELAALRTHESTTSPNVIDVVSTLGILWRSQVPWDEARRYLECVFALAPDARPSSPGDSYQHDEPMSPSRWGG